MKKIAVVTATRAEYGLLKEIICKLNQRSDIIVELIVTGTHLSEEFGYTYKEIEADGLVIFSKIPILEDDDSAYGVTKTMANSLVGFGKYFAENKPDMLLVLGDRYETFAICAAAFNERIPIAHLYGGETTEGAVDEAYRHAISKMSSLHFTSTEEYRKRVIQLGENPQTVFNVGAMGIENIYKQELLSEEILREELNIGKDIPYACVTFHPVTLEDDTAVQQIQELLQAVKEFPNMKFVFTKANADNGGRAINKCIEEFSNKCSNVLLFDSLGIKKYLSCVKYSEMVIGNSSSGLIEVPSLKVPTVNIGERQKGRLKAESVIDCLPNTVSIKNAMEKALTKQMKEIAQNVVNPYGDGNTSPKVVDIICNTVNNEVAVKKSFYDIEFEVLV